MKCVDCIHRNVCTQEKYATDITPYIDYSIRDDVEKECEDFLRFSHRELLALRAVAYGCNTNRKCAMGTFVYDVKNYKEENAIDFDDAIISVYDLIKRIEERTSGQ